MLPVIWRHSNSKSSFHSNIPKQNICFIFFLKNVKRTIHFCFKSVYLNIFEIMGTDFRREWVKNTVTRVFGLSSGHYFEDMMASGDDLEDRLSSYLEDDQLDQELSTSNDRFFYIYRTSFEKLVEKEILVPEIGKSFPHTARNKSKFFSYLFCSVLNFYS